MAYIEMKLLIPLPNEFPVRSSVTDFTSHQFLRQNERSALLSKMTLPEQKMELNLHTSKQCDLQKFLQKQF